MPINILPDFYSISRSHMYWGRKSFHGLERILEDLKPGQILLDPFCGAGTSIITALAKGARVIGSDLNPMAIFLSKVLIQPVSLFSLERTFETIRKTIASNVLDRYTINCPGCKRKIFFDYLQWNKKNSRDVPEAVKLSCTNCGISGLYPLTEKEVHRQFDLSKAKPQFWFPRKTIRARRKTHVRHFHELFTGRNLSALSELFDAITKISSTRSRQTLQYTFTAMLYSCSQMQMFSRKSPSSSRGWTAPRFYLPPARMEKNVWKTFEVRFKNTLNCKAKLNSLLGALSLADSLEQFETSSSNLYFEQADCMSLPFPKRLEVNHVFVDPPYNDDVDYLGFSEFWGSWLGMKFPIEASWRPGMLSIEDNISRIQNLLEQVRKNTSSSCIVILAYGSKRPKAWPLILQAVTDAGYQIQNKSSIFLDNSRKRKPKDFGVTDLYLVLKRSDKQSLPMERPVSAQSTDISLPERNELTLFVRACAYFLSLSHSKYSPGAEKILEITNDLVRPFLREKLSGIIKNNIIEWASDNEKNRKAYHTLCVNFISKILLEDGFTIKFAKPHTFDIPAFSELIDFTSLPKPEGVETGADFVACNNSDYRLVFCLFDKEKEQSYTKIANSIINKDKNLFRLTHYLIFPRHDDMDKYRDVGFADRWPRGFLLSFAEIVKRMTILYPENYPHFPLFLKKSISDFREKQKIGHFTAAVLDNKPVCEGEDCKHFRIKFKAPELRFVVPGQFVMIDTLPTTRRKQIENRKALLRKYPRYTNIADLTPKSYLKRPFSIHRAFYEHFGFGYLKNISLPPNLAPVLHTVFPNRFEIFYKVLDDGVGTNELRNVKRGEKIEMVGPLGRITDLAGLRSQGITEVHLVGGGVGMAPLIFFGQALKFYSFKVKAFIGIDRIETLLFSAPFAPTFSEERENAYVYIENLSNIGLDLDDIYVSTEYTDGPSAVFSRLTEKNRHVGFVSEQYASYLNKQQTVSNILVIACGPQPMLQVMERITRKHNIPMKVLMEKRMACGIGVCMSCVCKIKKDNRTEYSRVCTDGPIFDSKDIVWDI